MNLEQNFYHEQTKYGLNLAFCGREVCQNGHSFGPARRVHYLLHFIDEGCGYYHVNGQRYTLSEGDAFLIMPGDVTYYRADYDLPWSYCWIALEGPDVLKLLVQCGLNAQQLIYHSKSPSQITSLLNNIVDCALTPSTHYLSQLSKIFELFSAMSEGIKPSSKMNKTVIKNAKEFIESNYSYNIKVIDIAKAVNLERTYLYRLFIDELGLSPKKYLTNYRLEVTKELLSTQMSMTEIAYTCGFMSSSGFHKHFKAHYNLTPTEYRKSL
jgi:AraC-like DNA-binding protein